MWSPVSVSRHLLWHFIFILCVMNWVGSMTRITWLNSYNSYCSPRFGSFAQWQYRSQWGLSEARLLLIENYTQYPALTAWKTADCAIFVGFYGSQFPSMKCNTRQNMSNVRTSEEISRFDSLNIHICIHPQMALTLISLLHDKERPHITVGTAGVVVSCKIPILATRVRFPGSATDFC